MAGKASGALFSSLLILLVLFLPPARGPARGISNFLVYYGQDRASDLARLDLAILWVRGSYFSIFSVPPEYGHSCPYCEGC